MSAIIEKIEIKNEEKSLDKVVNANVNDNDDNDDNDNDEDNDDDEGEEGTTSDKKKKKKKKKSKKKKNTISGTTPSHSRLLGGYTDYYIKYGQTEPPTIPVADLFPSNIFPKGEIQQHGKTKYPVLTSNIRVSNEEKR
jgi:methionyl aminopeptidase